MPATFLERNLRVLVCLGLVVVAGKVWDDRTPAIPEFVGLLVLPLFLLLVADLFRIPDLLGLPRFLRRPVLGWEVAAVFWLSTCYMISGTLCYVLFLAATIGLTYDAWARSGEKVHEPAEGPSRATFGPFDLRQPFRGARFVVSFGILVSYAALTSPWVGEAGTSGWTSSTTIGQYVYTTHHSGLNFSGMDAFSIGKGRTPALILLAVLVWVAWRKERLGDWARFVPVVAAGALAWLGIRGWQHDQAEVEAMQSHWGAWKASAAGPSMLVFGAIVLGVGGLFTLRTPKPADTAQHVQASS